MTNPPGHLWRDEWTALSGPLSGRHSPGVGGEACVWRANMAHTRQSRPDSGLGLQLKVLKTFEFVLSSRESGVGRHPPGVGGNLLNLSSVDKMIDQEEEGAR